MKRTRFLSIFVCIFSLSIFLFGCSTGPRPEAVSDTGITKAHMTIPTDVQGLTIEQKNIMDRLKNDNMVGAVKHLYIISSYTGDVLQYSTVRGKVTSGNKRLTPKTVVGEGITGNYNWVNIGGKSYVTDETLDDGGAYGDSGNYLFWFDAQGSYQQYYPSGGTYLHISDRPLRVHKANYSVTLLNNEETTTGPVETVKTDNVKKE